MPAHAMFAVLRFREGKNKGRIGAVRCRMIGEIQLNIGRSGRI